MTPQDGQADEGINRRAVDSLVMAILALMLFPIAPFYAIRALMAGYKAYDQIEQSAGAQGGKAFAVVGVALGYLDLVLWALFAPYLAQVFLGALARY
jgi:hypothetical protein